jgi:hypothetical protein
LATVKSSTNFQACQAAQSLLAHSEDLSGELSQYEADEVAMVLARQPPCSAKLNRENVELGHGSLLLVLTWR